MSSEALVGRFSIGDLIKSGAISAHKDGNFGSLYPRIDDFVDDGLPLLTAKVVNGGRIDFDAAQRLRKEKAARLPYGFIQAGDVLLSHNATVGRVAVVPEFNGQALIGTSLTYFRLDKSRLLPRYLACFFESRDFQNQLASVMGLSTRNQVPITAQRLLKIEVPTLTVQRQISDFVGAIDDRITLLRETNATLEAIAQALFKSWFVDFDPVRAKQEGRAPEGMDDATAALFPDGFEESKLGAVPRGWSTRPIYELATYINGAAYKAFEPNSVRQGLPIIKIAELKAGVTSQTAYSNVAMPEKYLIYTGEILFSWSGNPDTSIDTFVWHQGQAWLNQHIFRVIPFSASERPFVLQTLRYLRPVFAELARNKQTTGLGHVTVADMKRLHVVQPDGELLNLFARVVAPIHERIFENEQQVQTLVTLRDTLLPRLISGRLRLPEAEAAVAAAL
jgi:type I restriction enzyme, S subunit